jgi:hypothetical protein
MNALDQLKKKLNKHEKELHKQRRGERGNKNNFSKREMNVLKPLGLFT